MLFWIVGCEPAALLARHVAGAVGAAPRGDPVTFLPPPCGGRLPSIVVQISGPEEDGEKLASFDNKFVDQTGGVCIFGPADLGEPPARDLSSPQAPPENFSF